MSLSWNGAASWNCSTVNMQGGLLGEGSELMLESEDMVWDATGECLELGLANRLCVVGIIGMV